MNTKEQNEIQLTAYALGELDEAERAEVEAQLATDPDARDHVEQVRATATRLRDDLQLEQAAASFILSTGISIGPSWAPTSKLVFEARYVHEKREYEGDPSLSLPGSTGIRREDTFNGLRIAAGYTPVRSVRVSLAFERGDRDSNILLRDYDYNRVSANAQFRF